MKKLLRLAFACGVFLLMPTVRAAAPAPSELERTVFLSMALDSDYVKSRLGTRILSQQFAQDDSICDAVAEKLLKEPAVPAGALAVDAIQWYVVAIRESCSGRYHEVLTTARQRFTHPKILKHIDAALAVPADISVPQYKEGGVDLPVLQRDLMQQLSTLRGSSASARGVARESTLGEVMDRAGLPQDLEQLAYSIAKWGHTTVLVAHYRNAGMLIFRRDYNRKHWVLAEILEELAPLGDTYKGKDFGIAQSLVCLRGRVFREYIKRHGRQIRRDQGLMWALANRLTRVPFASDRFEEDGLLVGVKIIASSRDPEALRMLQQIGSAPGDDIPEEARAYAQKLERNGVTAEAPTGPEDTDEADEPGESDEAAAAPART